MISSLQSAAGKLGSNTLSLWEVTDKEEAAVEAQLPGDPEKFQLPSGAQPSYTVRMDAVVPPTPQR